MSSKQFVAETEENANLVLKLLKEYIQGMDLESLRVAENIRDRCWRYGLSAPISKGGYVVHCPVGDVVFYPSNGEIDVRGFPEQAISLGVDFADRFKRDLQERVNERLKLQKNLKMQPRKPGTENSPGNCNRELGIETALTDNSEGFSRLLVATERNKDEYDSAEGGYFANFITDLTTGYREALSLKKGGRMMEDLPKLCDLCESVSDCYDIRSNGFYKIEPTVKIEG